MIPFNKPFLTGKEAHYMYHAVYAGKLSGNGEYTKKCHAFFENRYGMGKCLLTSSGTDALEMCAILCDLKPGDEVIVPSYTFVSTALAFLRERATVVFADSMPDNPNIDASKIESLITERTRVIVPVHYAGVACDMDTIMDIARRHNLIVVEDAAQAIDSYYKGRPLGSIGDMAAFSFHETKNVIAGEGGMLVVNNDKFRRRAEIIWEKGTNRAEFFRGEVNKYGWCDMGSSFLPSEIISAFLYAQLENIDDIQDRRKHLWQAYDHRLRPLSEAGYFTAPSLPDYASNNAHMYYLVMPDIDTRTRFIKYMKDNGVLTVFHYQSLHASKYYNDRHDGRRLPHSDRYTDCLVRLPMYYDLSVDEVEHICDLIVKFFTESHNA